MAETTKQKMNPKREKALRDGKIKYNESYDEFPLFLNDQPERSKREDSERFDKIFQEMKKKYHNMLVNLSKM
jgi:hypothetical protein